MTAIEVRKQSVVCVRIQQFIDRITKGVFAEDKATADKLYLGIL